MEILHFGNYFVHMQTNQLRLYFDVYEACEWWGFTDGRGQTYAGGWVYQGEDGDIVHEFDKDKCENKLDGSFCWRGVWEGRLSFPAEEYWGEELGQLSELYNDNIVPWCKDFIKNREPDTVYDD